jgi:hypothetical protein
MFTLTVDRCIRAFQAAVVGLIPAAEMEALSWRAEDAHDEWEQLVESAFDVLVRHPVEQSAHIVVFGLPRYDFDVRTYSAHSWLEFGKHDAGRSLVLVRLTTETSPFDSGEFAWVDTASGERLPGMYETCLLDDDAFHLRRRDDTSSWVVSDLQVAE